MSQAEKSVKYSGSMQVLSSVLRRLLSASILMSYSQESTQSPISAPCCRRAVKLDQAMLWEEKKREGEKRKKRKESVSQPRNKTKARLLPSICSITVSAQRNAVIPGGPGSRRPLCAQGGEGDEAQSRLSQQRCKPIEFN